MPRGGARQNGGKRKGQWDRATLEAELAAAQQQLVELTRKRQAGRKLAIDVLDDVMHLAMGLAGKHQPLSVGEVANPAAGRDPNDAKFDHYLDVTIEAAGKLANFQTPKFKSTTISIENLQGQPASGTVMNNAPAAHTITPLEAYRMLRDSSDLIELNPVVKKPKAAKPVPQKKAARG